MKIYKRIMLVLFILLILFLSLWVFPMLNLGFFGGLGGRIHIGNVIGMSIFIVMWLLILFIAVRFKSKAIFNLYICYWFAVSFACFALIFAVIVEVGGYILFFLYLYLVIPISGVFYLIETNTILDIIVLSIIPFSLLVIGFFTKSKTLSSIQENAQK